MPAFILALIFSSVLCLALIVWSKHYFYQGLDQITGGPQKVHTAPTPRIGGLGIFISMVLTVVIAHFVLKRPNSIELIPLLVVALPVFLGGLVEDFTGGVGPRYRLGLALISAFCAAIFLDNIITRTGFTFSDYLLQTQVIAISLTLLMTTGLVNSINLIDGFNGLASIVCLLILMAIFYIAFKVSDYHVMSGSLILAGAICGFIVWNYPYGYIFLGDSGAYFLGFWIAQLSIMLVNRNPEVSPWFAILINLYPVTETIFSIYRRKYIRKASSSIADGLHFHMLIYKRLVGRFPQSQKKTFNRNSLTAPYLWSMAILTIFPAVLFWREKWALIIFSFLFVLFYIWIYLRIIRFNIPRFFTLIPPLLRDSEHKASKK